MLKKDGFYKKVIALLILSSCLIVSLSFFLFSGKAQKLQETLFSKSTPEVSTPLPTKSSEPIVSPTPSIQPQPTPDVLQDSSVLRVVNKEHPISSTYVPNDLSVVNVNSNGEQLLRAEASQQLESMFQDAKEAGVNLYLVSGYRSYDHEKEVYGYYLSSQGEIEANRIDCHPSESEHQLGLAIDLGVDSHYCELNTCFSQSEAYTWLINHCFEYGYILRYPENKEDITGIKYSPWGFRYVGVDEAKKIYDSGLTMEEYYKEYLN